MTRITLIAIFLAPAAALAGPGDPIEELAFGHLLGFSDLNCPTGSQRFFQDGQQGLEELCLTPDGTRVGYYLRWHEDGDTWAVLGRYESGQRHGRWVRFDTKGEKVGVDYYERGRLKKKRDF